MSNDDDLALIGCMGDEDEHDGQEDDEINYGDSQGTPEIPGKKPRKPRKGSKAAINADLMATPRLPPCYGLIRTLLSPSQKSMSVPAEVIEAARANMQVLLRGRRVKLGHRPKAAITIFLSKLHDWCFLQDDRINLIELMYEVLTELSHMAAVMDTMGIESDSQWNTIGCILDHWWVNPSSLKGNQETWAMVMYGAYLSQLQEE